MNDDLKLREEVAVKVMGMKSGWRHIYICNDSDPKDFCVMVGVENGVELWELCPTYESDIAAAWMVVEKMREKGHGLKLESLNDDKFTCTFVDFHLGHRRERNNMGSDPIARAICLAALAAVGGI